MPLAVVNLATGRSQKELESMAQAVTDAIASTLASRPERIRVIVNEVNPEHWFVGGTTLKYMKETRPQDFAPDPTES